MVVGAPGSFAFHSTADATLIGQLTVGTLELGARPMAPAASNLPSLGIPRMSDLDACPDGWKPRLTLVDPRHVLRQRDLSWTWTQPMCRERDAVGTIPELGAALLQLTPEPAVGDFTPLDAAVA